MANSKSNEPGFDLILTYLDGFRLSKTLFTACGLGVFDALEMSAPYPAELGDVARRIKVSKDGLKVSSGSLLKMPMYIPFIPPYRLLTKGLPIQASARGHKKVIIISAYTPRLCT